MADGTEPTQARLRDAAARLDAAGSPVSADEIRGRHVPSGPTVRRLVLAGAAALLVVAGTLAVVTRDDASTTDILPADPSLTSTSLEPTTTLPPEDVTSETPVPPLDLAAFPSEGFAVSNPDGTTDLYDLSGRLLATTTTPDGANNSRQLVVSTRSARLELPIHAGALEVPPDCTSAVATPLGRLAICADGRAIHRIDEIGTTAVFMGEPATDPEWTSGLLGRWTRLVPSADGTQVLAQWSGECEVPTAFLLGDGNRAAFQTSEHWWDSPESTAIGWIDEQAIVEVGHGLCGTGFEPAGIYAVSFDKSIPTPLVAFDAEPGQRASFWRLGCNCGNAVETAVAAAIDSLGTATCCGEPSHGGQGVQAGLIFEDSAVAIWAQPTDRAIEVVGPGTVSETDGPIGAPARESLFEIFTPDGVTRFAGPVVTFTCGDHTFVLSHGDRDRPEIDDLLLVAESLAPRLGCTLRPAALAQEVTEIEGWLFDAIGDRYAYGCCADDGASPAGVAYGVVAEGATVPIFGEPTATIVDDAPAGLSTVRVEFLDGHATLAESSAGTVILVSCGDYSFTFGWYDDTVPDTDLMVRVGEDLVARMPCDLREPAIG